jgi:hypothetical protein
MPTAEHNLPAGNSGGVLLNGRGAVIDCFPAIDFHAYNALQLPNLCLQATLAVFCSTAEAQ